MGGSGKTGLEREAARPAWRRASICNGGECVEVASAGDGILLRHSTYPDTEVTVSGAEWRAFVAGVKAGEFDDLAGATSQLRSGASRPPASDVARRSPTGDVI